MGVNLIINSKGMLAVAILLFDEVEVLDFAGPHEVFAAAAGKEFDVLTVALGASHTISARGGLQVVCDTTVDAFSEADVDVDVLVIPGGRGMRTVLRRADVLARIDEVIRDTELVLSVCTGALLLAKLGYLSGKRATTHHTAFDELLTIEPGVEVVRDVRFVDEGSIIMAGGVSAGIDASLHVLVRLLGEEQASSAARYMEYEWERPKRTGRS